MHRFPLPVGWFVIAAVVSVTLAGMAFAFSYFAPSILASLGDTLSSTAATNKGIGRIGNVGSPPSNDSEDDSRGRLIGKAESRSKLDYMAGRAPSPPSQASDDSTSAAIGREKSGDASHEERTPHGGTEGVATSGKASQGEDMRPAIGQGLPAPQAKGTRRASLTKNNPAASTDEPDMASTADPAHTASQGAPSSRGSSKGPATEQRQGARSAGAMGESDGQETTRNTGRKIAGGAQGSAQGQPQGSEVAGSRGGESDQGRQGTIRSGSKTAGEAHDAFPSQSTSSKPGPSAPASSPASDDVSPRIDARASPDAGGKSGEEARTGADGPALRGGESRPGGEGGIRDANGMQAGSEQGLGHAGAKSSASGGVTGPGPGVGVSGPTTESHLLEVATRRICNIVNAGAVWGGKPGPCSSYGAQSPSPPGKLVGAAVPPAPRQSHAEPARSAKILTDTGTEVAKHPPSGASNARVAKTEPPPPSNPPQRLFEDERVNDRYYSLPEQIARVAGLGELPETAIEKALIEKYGKEKTEREMGHVSTALGLVPGVGTAKSLFEAYTGHDMLTGKPLSKLARGMTTLGLMTIGLVGASSLLDGSEEVALQASRLDKALAAEAGSSAEAKGLAREIGSDSRLFTDVRDLLVSPRCTLSAAKKVDLFERAVKELGEAHPEWRAGRKEAANALAFFTDGRIGYAVDEKGGMWETQDILVAGRAEKDGVYALDYAKWKRVESKYIEYPMRYMGKEPPAMPRDTLVMPRDASARPVATLGGSPYVRLREIFSPGTKIPANDNDIWIWVEAPNFRLPRSSVPGFDPRIDPSRVRQW